MVFRWSCAQSNKPVNPDVLRKRSAPSALVIKKLRPIRQMLLLLGGGGVGLAAAAAVLQAGKKPIVVEKFPGN